MGKKEVVFTFESTHQAILAEKLLKEGNIPLRVMALPAQIEAGCGLCIRIDLEDGNQAKMILSQHNVQMEGCFYKFFNEGKIQYYPC